jgi:sulfite reductase (NADPH) hemoprotein beta-component
MYIYGENDQKLIEQRVAQFRGQTTRFLAGKLTEDDFRPLRLKNGLYIQKHAPMLRVAIPYGLLSSHQLRALANISEKYDRGYGHFTTRQNIQFNWLKLEQVPDVLDDLSKVGMHAIQTSGNCIRNVTTDEFAGLAPDEVVNPLVWCELIRQWSTLHPEFGYLPRKFKIAVSGADTDRAAIRVHDIGLLARRNDVGEIGFSVYVGGGLGRTPIVGQVIREFLGWQDLLSYLDAILRVYNRFGRRDNKYKARIKILVKELGLEKFTDAVEAEWLISKQQIRSLTEADIKSIEKRFVKPEFEVLSSQTVANESSEGSQQFKNWKKRNVFPHRVNGYSCAVISLKKTGIAPGDITHTQMVAVADLADQFSFGELRVTHGQNLVLPHVRTQDLQSVYQALESIHLSTANIGLLTDMIACPGGDFCSLANAVSIPVANAIQERFESLDYLHDIGNLVLNISGCMNSCGHHHVGNIGILGVDKGGEEWYQITIGGRQGFDAAIGKVIGKSFPRDEVPDVIEKLIYVYIKSRESSDENFSELVARVGLDPFKQEVYGAH